MVLELPEDQPSFPDLSRVFPGALRQQRAMADLLGIAAEGCVDQRPWLRHGAWAQGVHPLRRDFPAATPPLEAAADYRFVRVAGEGVHEIPVGPVHAGTIEPGHFRFSVVGERVLRLEQHLGYTHKGIEKRFEGLDLTQGARLAGRVSGDSTVAFAWAFCLAAEGAAAQAAPARAAWLRALALERERVANHLGDLGFLGNDAGLGVGLAHFSRIKEDWLRTNEQVFGHRYLMDFVVPGGVARDLPQPALAVLRAELQTVESQVGRLQALYDEHPGLQDRLVGTGVVSPGLARQLGLCGLAGRASGQGFDLRVQAPAPPYDRLAVRMATATDGDVAARVALRFQEIQESLRLLRDLLPSLPVGPLREEAPRLGDGVLGLGQVEGWRGPVLMALEAGPGGSLRRVHPQDPSWLNWPALEHAIIGNIVPDFPLINKSFNLSYSGVDL